MSLLQLDFTQFSELAPARKLEWWNAREISHWITTYFFNYCAKLIFCSWYSLGCTKQESFPQAYFHAYKLKRCRVIGWSWSMLVWANLTKQKKSSNQGPELKFSTVTEIISPERRELKVVKIQDQLSVLKFFSFNNPLAL